MKRLLLAAVLLLGSTAMATADDKLILDHVWIGTESFVFDTEIWNDSFSSQAVEGRNIILSVNKSIDLRSDTEKLHLTVYVNAKYKFFLLPPEEHFSLIVEDGEITIKDGEGNVVQPYIRNRA